MSDNPNTIAWCPVCGDAMEYKNTFTADTKNIAQMNEHYYCFGCDKEFVFEERK